MHINTILRGRNPLSPNVPSLPTEGFLLFTNILPRRNSMPHNWRSSRHMLLRYL